MHPLRRAELVHHEVVIVGGGISGMYCARELARQGVTNILVIESLNEFGGRIETGDLRGFVAKTTAKRPMFKAEFGPMRFELDLQPLFKRLCEELGVVFGPFTPPAAPVAPLNFSLQEDEYDVDGETALGALELLKLGVYRMFGKTPKTIGDKVVLESDGGWLMRLRDDLPFDNPDSFEYLRINATSIKTGEPLFEMGFWNALAEVLSTEAIRKIQTVGTFYHLMATNPNAIEWGIFWLRLFQLGDASLSTIPAGVRTVCERLYGELQAKASASVGLKSNSTVTAIDTVESDASKVLVTIRENSPNAPREVQVSANHVVLAVPRAPLEELSAAFPIRIAADLGAVTGFALLKAFLCGRAPDWWPMNSAPTAQEKAWEMPTREVHYFREREGNAMTLLYMDEPASKYWAHFVRVPKRHFRAEYGGNRQLKIALVRHIFGEQRNVADALIVKPIRSAVPMDATDERARVLLELAEEIDLPAISQGEHVLPHFGSYSRLRQAAQNLLSKPSQVAPAFFESVSDYAIRDWSQPPFGGGCHAWRPGFRSWEVRARLRAFELKGSVIKNVHVCGEAYSDYQGFIEGALRSAHDAVATIVGTTPRYSIPSV